MKTRINQKYRNQDIINIKSEINETQDKYTMERISKTKADYLKK